MTITFEAAIVEWRGPPPYLFVPAPKDFNLQLKSSLAGLSYGWGCVPASARVGKTQWTTSLMPKDGRYLVPPKMLVQRAEARGFGDLYRITVEVG